MRTAELSALCQSIRAACDEVDDTYRRGSDLGGTARWQSAAARRFDLIGRFYRVVEEVVAALDTPTAAGVDEAVWFLEADPWCFFSGYSETKVMRRLMTAPLTDAQRERLSVVVLAAVDVGWRWEFRETIRLARRLG